MSVDNFLKVLDKNETLKAPKLFNCVRVCGDGPLLRLDYVQHVSAFVPHPVDTRLGTTHYVSIYLNDQGREVLRTMSTVDDEPAKDPEFDIDWSGTSSDHVKAPPTGFWEELKSWWRWHVTLCR